ncbi:hypothetical protein QMZ92_35095 [Streptomyces sp. HNM0645]|uniref:hypothetical protein n=1 Tax=Streptomyces sp. HNM0645 TaxID=2782343 RepID=UPI0024B8585E|nr:hypothetical protein [Streptomyces sp. HNM0645]MDI9889399.1 hypothetical protein [Streptomyces sp. HNM0645]
MDNSALWVALLTAATAVVASWVTSRGNAQAARVQAQAAAEAAHTARERETRRATQLDFIEQANEMGILYLRIPKYLKVEDQEARLASLTELRDQLRDSYRPFLRSLAVVSLECRPGPIAAANGVHAASCDAYGRLIAVEEDIRQADGFRRAVDAYQASVASFIEAARSAERET